VYNRTLVANDGSPGARKALAAMLAMARSKGAELHVITVEELPRFPAMQRSIASVSRKTCRLRPFSARRKIRRGSNGIAPVLGLKPPRRNKCVKAIAEMQADSRCSIRFHLPVPAAGERAWSPAPPGW
jgi:hypothetical protein